MATPDCQKDWKVQSGLLSDEERMHFTVQRAVSAMQESPHPPSYAIHELSFGNLFNFLFYFTKVQLNYNIGFISTVQQSDAVICRNCMCASHTHTSLFIFSIMVYHRILNTLPVLYGRALLLIHSVCNSLHPLTLNSRSIPSPPCSLLAVISQLSVFLNFAFTLSSSSPPVLT